MALEKTHKRLSSVKQFAHFCVAFPFVFLLGISKAYSQELREFYNNARMMGMGGASVAIANDETALLSNPAGLGKVRSAYGTILDPEIDVGSNYSAIYNGKAFTTPTNVQQVIPSAAVSKEVPFHWRQQLFPSFVVRNFGVGIYYKQSLDAVSNATGTSVTTNYRDDLALVLGYSLRLWDGRIKIGAGARYINRIEISKDLDPTGDLTLTTNASEGVGIGFDSGIILAAPWDYIPTLGIVARDLGNTKFTNGSNVRMTTTSRPATVTTDYDAAIALFPIHTNRTRTSFTLEYQKAIAASKAVNKSRHYAGGIEVNFADVLFFRGGMNQQYWTAGFELASQYTQLQLTSYGEDVGVDGTPIEDRRYSLKFAFRF